MRFFAMITFLIVAVVLFISTEAKCPEICAAVYQPVCAKDGKGNQKTFPSNCELSVEQCTHPERGYVYVKEGEC